MLFPGCDNRSTDWLTARHLRDASAPHTQGLLLKGWEPTVTTPHLTGKVADVAFRGRGYEYAIDLPGLGRITGVFARHRADRGDSVGLRLDPEGCHLFPAVAAPRETHEAAPAPALTAQGS